MDLGLLIFLAAAVMLVAAVLVLDIAGISAKNVPGLRRSAAHPAGWRLTGSGVLLASGVSWFSLFQIYRNRPSDHRHALNQYLLPLVLAGVVLILAANARGIRSRRAAGDPIQPPGR